MDYYKRKLKEMLIEERNIYAKKIGTVEYEAETLFYEIKKKLHMCARSGAELIEAFDFAERKEVASRVVELLLNEEVYATCKYDEGFQKYIIEASVIEKEDEQKPSLFQRIMSSKKIFG